MRKKDIAGPEWPRGMIIFLAKAECESDAKKRAELENLGWAFLRLAGQVRRNRATDIV